MAERPVLKIKADATGVGEFTIDGHDISNLVQRVDLHINSGADINRVTLTLIAPELDLEIEPELMAKLGLEHAENESKSIRPSGRHSRTA